MKLNRRGKTPLRWHWGFFKEFAVIRQKKGNASGSWQDRLKTAVVGAGGLNLPYYSSPRASADVCFTIYLSPRGAGTHRHWQFSQNVSSASNWASIRRQTDSPFVRQTGAMLTHRRKERRESQFTERTVNRVASLLETPGCSYDSVQWQRAVAWKQCCGMFLIIWSDIYFWLYFRFRASLPICSTFFMLTKCIHFHCCLCSFRFLFSHTAFLCFPSLPFPFPLQYVSHLI